MLKREVLMNSNIEELQKLRNMAILCRSPFQFGLTSLLINLKYRTDLQEQEKLNKDEEMVL